MADILIRGMEMPKNCYLCPCSSYIPNGRGRNGVQFCNLLKDYVDMRSVDERCPLAELPPHGRLIDADAIPYVQSINKWACDDYAYRYDINEMPTIIEAEGGGKDGC